jgi:branched-chain amino acid transport system substrate-binding protein
VLAATSEINVGVIVPLSAANAQLGINSGNDIELVADEINTTGWIKELGGAKINLIVADSTSTPTTAGTVAQRLIKQEVVVAILGASAACGSVSNRSDHHEINYARWSCSPPWQRQDVPLLQVVAKAGAGQGRLDP